MSLHFKFALALWLLLPVALVGQPRRVTPLGANGKRPALVVGNDNYQPLRKLHNAVNDARAMSGALREVGFEVVEVEDVTAERLATAVSQFTAKIRPGDVVWFEPGEKHWHGASPTVAMIHIAVQEALDGKVVEQGRRNRSPRL